MIPHIKNEENKIFQRIVVAANIMIEKLGEKMKNF